MLSSEAGESIHNDVAMLKPKIATPMLEAFLRQAAPPNLPIAPVWQDWLLALAAFLVCVAIPLPFFDWILGCVVGGAVLYARSQIRQRQVQALTPRQKSEWERWTRVARLKSLIANGILHSHVPAPVLAALEMTARSWHELREEVQSLGAEDAFQAAEITVEVDAIMALAASAAGPVIRSDEQGRRHLRQMEEDEHLMASVCRRIEAQRLRLERWSSDTEKLASDKPETLRERIARAKSERLAAEAELDEVWTPSLKEPT